MASGNAVKELLLRLKGDNADAQRSIKEIISLVEKQAKTVNESSAVGVRAFRAEADEARALLTQLGATERQHAQLGRAVQGVEQSVEGFRGRMGMAARQIASGFENVARSGKLSGEAVKQVLTQGADMAFLFGPMGAIAGALAIGGAAIVEYFTGIRKQLEETRKKFDDSLADMVRSGDQLGKQRALQMLYLGDPAKGLSAAAPGSYQGGLNDLKAQAAALKDAIAGLEAQAGPLGAAGGILTMILTGGKGGDLSLAALKKTLHDVNAQIAEAQRQEKLLVDAIMNPVPLPTAPQGLAPVVVAGHTAQQTADDLKKAREELEKVQRQITDADATFFSRPASGVYGFGGAVPGDVSGGLQAVGKGALAATPPLSPTDVDQAAVAATKQVDAAFASAGQRVGEGFANAIGEGFATAIQTKSLSAGFAALGKGILASLGGIMTQMGQALISYGVTMLKLLPALKNIFTSGPAAIAAGIALTALGSTLGAIAHGRGASSGGGGGGGGGYGGSSATDYVGAARQKTTIVLPPMPDGGTFNPQFRDWLAGIFRDLVQNGDVEVVTA